MTYSYLTVLVAALCILWSFATFVPSWQNSQHLLVWLFASFTLIIAAIGLSRPKRKSAGARLLLILCGTAAVACASLFSLFLRFKTEQEKFILSIPLENQSDLHLFYGETFPDPGPDLIIKRTAGILPVTKALASVKRFELGKWEMSGPDIHFYSKDERRIIVWNIASQTIVRDSSLKSDR